MFAHIFTTRLKCLLRDRMSVFWTLLFPIVLALFFNVSLRNIDNMDRFTPTAAAVVDDAAYQNDAGFRAALEAVSTGDDRLFALSAVSKSEADELLKSGKISGYFSLNGGLSLTVNASNFDTSLMETFADSYLQMSAAAGDILSSDPTAYEKLAEALSTQAEYLRDVPVSSAEPDSSFAYFYSLLAMTCLYAGFWGVREITDIQADLSARAARVNIAPVKKNKAFFSSMSASFVLSFSEILILLAFLRFVLGIGFGTRAGLVVLTSLVGCLLGLSGGAFIAAVVKGGEDVKTGIMLCFTMVGCVLAGMMYQGIKTDIQNNIPVLGWLNPVNLLSDAYYALYYFDSLDRYLLNIGVLCAFVAVFSTGTYLTIRRRKYASL
ncbi:MAG: ABC transporter permease [Oscillospiraceae bacterium]|jgi:ABC-2 type transport system permease protein